MDFFFPYESFHQMHPVSIIATKLGDRRDWKGCTLLGKDFLGRTTLILVLPHKVMFTVIFEPTQISCWWIKSMCVVGCTRLLTCAGILDFKILTSSGAVSTPLLNSLLQYLILEKVPLDVFIYSFTYLSLGNKCCPARHAQAVEGHGARAPWLQWDAEAPGHSSGFQG